MNQFVSVLSALLTPLIAVIAAYIAYQQHRTNRDKLRLDLYDRRFEVYGALADLCVSVASSGKPGSAELNRFLQSRHKTQFLFDPGIADYLETIRKKAVRAEYLHHRLNSDGRLPVGDERTSVAEEHSNIMKWFGDQYVDSKVKFAPYFVFG